jgi:hypothetical protein
MALGFLSGGGRMSAGRLVREGRGAHPPARAFDVLGCGDHIPGSQLPDAVRRSDLRKGHQRRERRCRPCPGACGDAKAATEGPLRSGAITTSGSAVSD